LTGRGANTVTGHRAGAAKRGPGRPRDESLDAAILDAAVDELTERGYLGLSIEAVAARAGVAKTTLYRRWPSVQDLVIDALRTLHGPAPDLDDALPTRERLLGLLDSMRRSWADERYAAVMRRVSADGTSQPELYRESRERLVGPWVETMVRELRRARDEGVIRADADLAAVRSLLCSPIMADALTHKPPMTKRQLRYLFDTVLAGVAP
jgi:AcrR family transcriptional regulator